MKTNKIKGIIVSALLLSAFALNSLVSGVNYLPDVTKDMSSFSYWADETEVFMSYEEIKELNKKTIAAKGTNMYDLANLPDTVNGVSLNEALKKSSGADAAYFLTWTYLENGERAIQEDFDRMIENTQNPDAKENQAVLYGIATKRTHLRALPTDEALLDSPSDPDTDNQYLVGIRVNEPVVITSKSKDGKYYLAKNVCCSGWIPSDCVAICKDKEEWLTAWDIDNEDALVVWGDKVYTEYSNAGKETSELMLTMGTVLRLADDVNPNDLTDLRAAYNNHVVWMPVRNEDGSYSKKLTLISESEAVFEGYLPLTKQNIAKVALSSLGNVYGWGGSLNSEDCSGYMRNIYKCFGFELARNTTWQTSMPMAKVDMKNMAKEERIKMLDGLTIGTILYISGHEMMYLGSDNGKYYVISAVGTIMQPENPKVRQRICSVAINTLDVKRANGNTWLDELTCAIVPYYGEDVSLLPEYEWYHDGVVYCIKNKIMQGDENKFFNPSKNITWAEILQILYNMEETKPEAVLDEDALWYEAAVTWALENELVYEEDKDFDPNIAITREEFSSVIYLYALFKGEDVRVGEETNILSYDDFSDISEYAIPAMQFVCGAEIMNGKTQSTLNPKDNTTRAEVAVMLERFISYNIRMEEIRKNTVDYTRDFTSFMYQPEAGDEVLELLKTVDRCPYGTAGSSLMQISAAVCVLELSKKENIESNLSGYIDGMDATQKDYFSFQWQMCMKKANAILENPDAFKDVMNDAGLEDVDLSVFDKDKVNLLDSVVTAELEKRDVKYEWKNHSEEEPFAFWDY